MDIGLALDMYGRVIDNIDHMNLPEILLELLD